jgi:hypothetical protein
MLIINMLYKFFIILKGGKRGRKGDGRKGGK